MGPSGLLFCPSRYLKGPIGLLLDSFWDPSGLLLCFCGLLTGPTRLLLGPIGHQFDTFFDPSGILMGPIGLRFYWTTIGS